MITNCVFALNARRSRIASLEEELARKRREKDELKAKCRKYAAAAEAAETRLLREQCATVAKTIASGPECNYVPLEEHKKLQQSYKELLSRHRDFASLLNNALDLSPSPSKPEDMKKTDKPGGEQRSATKKK